MNGPGHMANARGFELLTRIGFAARGALYLTIGYLAIEAGRTESSTGVLRMFAEGGAARLALAVIALGLLAYGAWRLLCAAYDLEGKGHEAKGAVSRAGQALSGAIHVGLGLLAGALLLGLASAGSGGGSGGGSIAAWVLDLPGGELILRGAAVAIILGGLSQAWAAYKLDFLEQLDAEAARRAWVAWSGRIGYVARGVVFVLVGLMLWKAAGQGAPEAAGGTAEALATLEGWQRTAVAAGLCLFGVFSIVQALYRRIAKPDLHRVSHRPRQRTA